MGEFGVEESCSYLFLYFPWGRSCRSMFLCITETQKEETRMTSNLRGLVSENWHVFLFYQKILLSFGRGTEALAFSLKAAIGKSCWSSIPFPSFERKNIFTTYITFWPQWEEFSQGSWHNHCIFFFFLSFCFYVFLILFQLSFALRNKTSIFWISFKGNKRCVHLPLNTLTNMC